MTFLIALLVGFLYTAGIYMILRRSIVKVLIGLIFLGHATHLLIFSVGRLTRGAPPFISDGATTIVGEFSEPIPQALILTAIVISFGVQAFALVLFKRAYQTVKTDDIQKLNTTDQV